MPLRLVRALMAAPALLLLGAVWLEENRPENALPAGVEWALAALIGGLLLYDRLRARRKSGSFEKNQETKSAFSPKNVKGR